MYVHVVLQNSIDLVVAVNPDFDQGEGPIESPQTMWPPKKWVRHKNCRDVVCNIVMIK